MKKLWKPALLLAAITVMVIGTLGSGAWFTDTATNSTGTITSGTLNIDGESVNTQTIGTIVNMAPGDRTGEAVIIIKNIGTLPLAWFGNLVIETDPEDAALKDAIYIDYAKMEFLAPSGDNWQGSGGPKDGPDNFILKGFGSGPYPDWYNTLAAKGPFPVISLSDFDGTTAMGVAPYEFNGALKPDYSYKLTLKFGFYDLADNTYQGMGPMNISLVVNATQIKKEAIEAIEGYNAWAMPNLMTWLDAQIADQVEP